MDWISPTDAALQATASVPEMIARGEMVFLASEAPDDPEDFAEWLSSANFCGHVSETGEVSAVLVGDIADPLDELVDISERVYGFAQDSG
jgi:hypothetical protein